MVEYGGGVRGQQQRPHRGPGWHRRPIVGALYSIITSAIALLHVLSRHCTVWPPLDASTRYLLDLRTGELVADGPALTRQGYSKLEPGLNLGNFGTPVFFWILKARTATTPLPPPSPPSLPISPAAPCPLPPPSLTLHLMPPPLPAPPPTLPYLSCLSAPPPPPHPPVSNR